jgi:predicted amidohydrolase
LAEWGCSKRCRDWAAAAETVADETGIPLVAGTVGLTDTDYLDARGAYTRSREISPAGVVLVRADRYVSFRSLGKVDDPVASRTR